MEYRNSTNAAKNDIQVLLEKFRVLTEALKDSLKNLGSALDNSVIKLSKSIDEKIDKINVVHTIGQLEELNREKQETGTRSSNPNGKRRVAPAKLPGNPNKKRIISQDDNSLSLFRLSDVEDDLQREENDPLCGQ